MPAGPGHYTVVIVDQAGKDPQPGPADPTGAPTRALVRDNKPAVQVRRLRRGRLAVRKIDPGAVLKFSLVFYFCMLLIMMLATAIIFAFLKAFGVNATVHNALLVQVVDSLATLFPATPGGAGTKQGLTEFLFRGRGVPHTLLLAFSVGMNITIVTTATTDDHGRALLRALGFPFRRDGQG